MKKMITCTVCPMGCSIAVEGENAQVVSVEGASCSRGVEYAQSEFLHPVRILTSSVRMKEGAEVLMPVRSTKGIPKERLFDCIAELRKIELRAPVELHEIVIRNILDTGADLVTTSSIGKH